LLFTGFAFLALNILTYTLFAILHAKAQRTPRAQREEEERRGRREKGEGKREKRDLSLVPAARFTRCFHAKAQRAQRAQREEKEEEKRKKKGKKRGRGIVLVDAHCHPYDLAEHLENAEEERRRLDVICASSTATIEEFEFCERLSVQAKADNAPPLLPCFAVHPQMPLVIGNGTQMFLQDSLSVLDTLAAQKRLGAVGETGFDLYNAAFKETEKIQDELFEVHLEIALRYDLPLVIHSRRAMHKIFANAAALKKCRAVIFHSWSGTEGEGKALLMRGINAFFSFGAVIMLNHKEAMHCCAAFPADRLLTETDAPFQPPRGKEFSRYADIKAILGTIETLRAQPEMENIIETNFRAAFY
jgi:TatD DNase family protein